MRKTQPSHQIQLKQQVCLQATVVGRTFFKPTYFDLQLSDGRIIQNVHEDLLFTPVPEGAPNESQPKEEVDKSTCDNPILGGLNSSPLSKLPTNAEPGRVVSIALSSKASKHLNGY